jgi:predicted short-subunit dehydrogenase-like oxidoreductase (DUF2520 family)
VKKYGISFIGAGKVAGVLSRAFSDSGHRITSIVSRRKENCRELVESLNSTWSSDLSFSDSTDIIVIAVPDDTIREVSCRLRCPEKTIVAHTAGSIGIDVFPPELKHTGVLYPLQTFSPGRKINFRDLPFFIEASDRNSETVLVELVDSLEAKAYFAEASSRRLLHVAAVFACNFTNHMLAASKIIAAEAGEEFSTLEPLVRETILKAFENGPMKSQTGPAVRSDTGTIEKHIELLSFSPELQQIYKQVTSSIMDLYKKKSI